MTDETQSLSDPQADPVTGLHRMSRTAGLGSQDYVAINGTSISALVFGLASAAVLLSPIFLVIPTTGIVLAIFALRQIGNSNGTQSGREMAWCGMVLAVLLLAFSGGQAVWSAWNTHGDEVQIARVLETLGKNLNEQKFDQAYGQFSGQFQTKTSRARFDEVMTRMRQSRFYGPVKDMHWNGRASFESQVGESITHAEAFAIVHLESGGETREHVLLVREDGQWKIDDVAGWPFAPPPPPGSRAPVQLRKF
ncbi:MAG: DUF4190 domain-containing protein [Tepidisphaeraceae bacterium]